MYLRGNCCKYDMVVNLSFGLTVRKFHLRNIPMRQAYATNFQAEFYIHKFKCNINSHEAQRDFASVFYETAYLKKPYGIKINCTKVRNFYFKYFTI